MTSLSPLLYPPPKKTEEVDFGPSFRAYIASAYGDEPEKYAAEIGLLNRLRDDTRGAGKDITGRDILYRYYGQLELLDLRFPIDEKHVKVLFTWSDAFTGKTVSQNAVAYEKACVIFSLAATCGAIAGSQERNDPHALKVAFNHLQAAAGLFAYINDNFLHPPSVDLSRESVKALETLMLAQAQELFVEKCLVENKQGQLVAKLSAQAALLYGNAKDALSDDALKQQINRAWIDMAKCKQNYFESLAHYHRSIQLESEGKYGHVVSHMLKADTLAKDAESLAKYFGRTYPSFTVAASNPQNSSLAILSALGASATPSASASPAGALIEMTKAFALKVLERKNSVVKDNDVIYHEPTPSVDTLPAIDKLAAAKGITFAELCPNGAADVPKIVGPDIFVKLVPLSVHTAASVYSEEQAKLLRGESAAVESADEELKVSLESMGIVASLDKLKRVLKGGSSGVQDVMGSDESLGLTEEVRGWCGTIRSQEIGRGTGTDELLGVIEGLKGKIKGTLDEIGLLLDKEQHECESMRVKYMNAWNQEPSVKLTNQIRYDVRSHRESFDQALATDQGLLARLNECRRDVATMSRPLDEVQSIFAELIRAVATLKKSDVAVGNLIDDVPGSEEGLGKLGEQITVEKLDGMIQQLRKLKNERATLLAELKTKVREDDISKALLLNKNKESQVFQAELAKFKPYQAKIKVNVDTHSQLLVDIASEFEKLKNSSTTIKVLELRERRRNEIIKEWKESFVLWKEAKEGLNRGVRFYTDLSDLAQSLKNTVVGFVNRRGEESAALIKRIEAEEAMKGQRQLQNEMARLSVTASGPPPPQPYPSSYASPTVSSPGASSATRSSYPPAPVPAPVPQPTYSQPHHSLRILLPLLNHSHSRNHSLSQLRNRHHIRPNQLQLPVLTEELPLSTNQLNPTTELHLYLTNLCMEVPPRRSQYMVARDRNHHNNNLFMEELLGLKFLNNLFMVELQRHDQLSLQTQCMVANLCMEDSLRNQHMVDSHSILKLVQLFQLLPTSVLRWCSSTTTVRTSLSTTKTTTNSTATILWAGTWRTSSIWRPASLLSRARCTPTNSSEARIFLCTWRIPASLSITTTLWTTTSTTIWFASKSVLSRLSAATSSIPTRISTATRSTAVSASATTSTISSARLSSTTTATPAGIRATTVWTGTSSTNVWPASSTTAVW
ncbi:BRO1-domain-containing protein [Rhizoclosmatium globosum]|uniref:BRO domain-containing protein 1 n=1 Tax=Rhizoclosmatium globosum TaxID=329046 RepID=A0A1Y2CPI2_9FUNG|nr:BRO1-domain-containing protein [Rhizoclosmatium globosum]|eukprot:ORY48912.1 BRO1-domain-containing protein [Rhizoclosmatium globosum]